MEVTFFKYQGAGNDFVIIDDRQEALEWLSQPIIEKWCDRRFGIGADGLILLREKQNLLQMVYYNSDGRESSMCGNGGRCFAAFAKQIGAVSSSKFVFEAIDGLHEVEFIGDLVNLKMQNVATIENLGQDFFLDTGSPHYVSFCENVDRLDFLNQAHKVRYNERFKQEGTNVNFVSVGKEKLEVRTYERGVEGETLACGTGVTAVALVAEQEGVNTHPNKSVLKVQGGELEVSYSKTENGFENIWLKGPAEFVFEGVVRLSQ